MLLLDAVTSSMATVISWIGTVTYQLLNGSLKHLLPLFAIGIAISAILLAVKIIRSVIWGA